MYILTRSGPNTEPWGTPCVSGADQECTIFPCTNFLLSNRYDVNQSSAEPLSPILILVFILVMGSNSIEL